MDQDRGFGVIAEKVAMSRRELGVISQGLDLCESTLRSNIAGVRTWVMSGFSRQQMLLLHMMETMTLLGQNIDRTRCAHHVEEKVVEGVGEVSGGHGSAGTNAFHGGGRRYGRCSGYARVVHGGFTHAGRDLRGQLRWCREAGW